MKNDIDIKSLWKGQQVPVIDLSAVRKKIKYFRLRRMGESCAVIMLMMLASASGVTVWIHWPPLLSVTKAGIILLSMGFMLPVLSYGRLLRLYYGLKTDCSNVDYMSNLLKIKKQEHRQQHIVLNLYFLVLSLGFSLYTYEYTFHHSSPRGIIAYSVLLSWISLNWFVFRPYIIKKTQPQVFQTGEMHRKPQGHTDETLTARDKRCLRHNRLHAFRQSGPWQEQKTERVGPQAEPTLSLFKRGYIYTKQPSSSSVRSSRTCLICCSCERGQISRASGVSTTI